MIRNFKLFLVILFLCYGTFIDKVVAQQDLYNWSVEPYTAFSEFVNTPTLSSNNLNPSFGLKINRVLNPSFSYGLIFSGGKLNNTVNGNFGSSALAITYRFDNGNLLSKDAFFAPYFSLGGAYIEENIENSTQFAFPSNNWKALGELGVKLRLSDRFNLIGFYSAYIPTETIFVDNGVITDYLQQLGVSFCYNFGLQKSKLKGPSYYVNEEHEQFNNIVDVATTPIILINDSTTTFLLQEENLEEPSFEIPKISNDSAIISISKIDDRKIVSENQTEVIEQKIVRLDTFETIGTEKVIKKVEIDEKRNEKSKLNQSLQRTVEDSNTLILLPKTKMSAIGIIPTIVDTALTSLDSSILNPENLMIQRNQENKSTILVAPKPFQNLNENATSNTAQIDSILNQVNKQNKLLNQLMIDQQLYNQQLNSRLEKIEGQSTSKIIETKVIPLIDKASKVDTVFIEKEIIVPSLKTENKSIHLYFPTNIFKVLDFHIDSIQELIKSQKINGGLFIISGYSDSQGDANYNLKLSKMRVDAVVEHLEKNGISDKEIVIQYFGEKYAKPNFNEKDRKVELQLIVQ